MSGKFASVHDGLDYLRSRLTGVIHDRDSGFVACCPAHDDRAQSLKVSSADGKLLVHCHAGCNAEDVVANLGLVMADLFVNGSNYSNGKQHEFDFGKVAMEAEMALANRPLEIEDLAQALNLPDTVFPSLHVGFLRTGPHADRRSEGCWTFPERDAHKQIIGITCRYENGDKKAYPGGKRGLFIPDGWDVNTDTVYLPEGASDTLCLTAMGLCAIGRPQAKHAEAAKYAAQILRGTNREIVVVADRDEKGAGKNGAIDAAAVLARALGRQICWAYPPDEAKDVRAWLAGKSLDSAGQLFRTSIKLEQGTSRTESQSGPATLFTFRDLRQQYPRLHEPIIDGLIRVGETCNIIAPSKIGKSWKAYGLALSIVTGHPWLGRFATRRGKVLFIDNELHRATLSFRINSVAEAMGISASDFEDDLHIWALRGALVDIEGIATGLQDVRPGEYAVVVIDAKYRALPAAASENDNAAETKLYNLVDALAERLQVAVILIHHSSKGSQSDKRVTDVGSGAGAQSRATDCHLVLREHEDDGVFILEAAVRSFKPVEPLPLKWVFPLWQPATDVDPTKLKGGKKSRQEELNTEIDREVLEAAKSRWLSESEIHKLTGHGKPRIKKSVNRLLAAKKLIASDADREGNSCKVYMANPLHGEGGT